MLIIIAGGQPTDYKGMAEVSRRTRGAQPCPRHVRTISGRNTMH